MYHLEKAFNVSSLAGGLMVVLFSKQVLETMHKSGAIPNDEVCYRVLMEQCVKLWKPYMAVKVNPHICQALNHSFPFPGVL